MARSAESTMARLCGRLMSTAQSALDQINYIVEEMEMVLEQNPDREDIKACIEEVKATNKATESKSWVTANHWGDHFDGVGGDSEEEPEEAENSNETGEDAPESDTDTDE